MPSKKEKILQSAFELFASQGFAATSTSRIAKKAGVSEGLIFRHFGNKEGLLEAILKEGEEKSKLLFADIVFETDPKEVIRKTINLSKKVTSNKTDAAFWKLQYKIKWEIERYGEHKMEAMEHALKEAFTKLGYREPLRETQILLLLLDGMATRIFLQEEFDLNNIIKLLFEKYKLD